MISRQRTTTAVQQHNVKSFLFQSSATVRTGNICNGRRTGPLVGLEEVVGRSRQAREAG
jgi:hypothetical protein